MPLRVTLPFILPEINEYLMKKRYILEVDFFLYYTFRTPVNVVGQVAVAKDPFVLIVWLDAVWKLTYRQLATRHFTLQSALLIYANVLVHSCG